MKEDHGKMREIKFRAWDRDAKIMYRPFTLFTKPDFIGPFSCEIMQSTGLCDKSGKKIYEGDILKIHPCFGAEWEPYLGIAEWDDKEFKWRISKYHSISFLNYDCDLQIIGNIYDNPELLEKK